MTGDADETALRTFFAAARAAEASPRTELLSAILADAADVTAARRPLVPAPAPPPGRATRLHRYVMPVGGWRGLATLAASAALGFWLGFAGDLTIDGATLDAGTAVAADTAADPVADFFDLASAEN